MLNIYSAETSEQYFWELIKSCKAIFVFIIKSIDHNKCSKCDILEMLTKRKSIITLKKNRIYDRN